MDEDGKKVRHTLILRVTSPRSGDWDHTEELQVLDPRDNDNDDDDKKKKRKARNASADLNLVGEINSVEDDQEEARRRLLERLRELREM